jgi:hypothetical protein
VCLIKRPQATQCCRLQHIYERLIIDGILAGIMPGGDDARILRAQGIEHKIRCLLLPTHLWPTFDLHLPGKARISVAGFKPTEGGHSYPSPETDKNVCPPKKKKR